MKWQQQQEQRREKKNFGKIQFVASLFHFHQIIYIYLYYMFGIILLSYTYNSVVPLEGYI